MSVADNRLMMFSIGVNSNYLMAPETWEADDTCATTEWSIWSQCSVLCGPKEGGRIRTRRFFHRRGRKTCPHVDTVEKESCFSNLVILAILSYMNCVFVQPCESDHSEEVVPPNCSVTEWSLWSPCSQTCGGGMKVLRLMYNKLSFASVRLRIKDMFLIV